MYFRRKTSAGRAYLQIVESRREGDQVRQQVIATLGRFEDLQASGQLERLVRSGARFAAKAMMLSAASNDAAIKIAVHRIGPALVFERLWEETGCRAVFADLAGKRGHKFTLERAVFLTVLHRLFVSGSDRAADRWREDYAIAGVEGLDLHHLYRAMAWLGEELPEKEQDGRTPFSPRCVKDVVEERLFAHRRDLFTRLDLVFMDTTSLYFEGAGGQTLGQHGYSKDHRPDLRQMILAVLLDGDGRPVCSEMWPGNTADVTTVIPVIDRLRRRFDITRVCVVADRGMISAETIAELEARRLLYILGVREDGRTPFSPRCVKDVVEERLFAHRRDLFTRLDLVFMDTTSLYFEGAGGQTLGQHGYSKDHRPDLRQMILAVLLDGDGRPVCSEMWPGNTADVTTVIPVIDRLRRRFDITRVCVVADRGMISAETIAELEARRLLYILGVRERTDKLVRELVLDDPAPFVPLVMKKRGKETDYEAKTVMLAGRRYIVCRNHQEAAKDAADRASIIAALERQLAKGDKALVGNTGYRRYLKTISQDHFAIDPDKVEEEKRFDGIFVLRTNTDLNPLEAMLCYKQLWTVEQTFRTAKHLFSTRPIFHKLDETIRGHVFCSFLALVLKKALEDRIAAFSRSGSWPEIIADLDSLTETEIGQDGKRFIMRSAPRPAASLAIRAAGVALPPTVRDASA